MQSRSLILVFLIPPYVVGDALADLVAVVETRSAHRSGLPARQPVTTGRENREQRKGEVRKETHGRGVFWQQRASS